MNVPEGMERAIAALRADGWTRPPPERGQRLVAVRVLAEPPVGFTAPPRRPAPLRGPWFTTEGAWAVAGAAPTFVLALLALSRLL